MTIIVDIIDTILSDGISDGFRHTSNKILWQNQKTHRGCKEPIPNFAANTPVMKGKTAEPA